MEIRSEPDGRDEEQDGKDDHQAVEHEDTGEEGREQQSWRKRTGKQTFASFERKIKLCCSLSLFSLIQITVRRASLSRIEETAFWGQKWIFLLCQDNSFLRKN